MLTKLEMSKSKEAVVGDYLIWNSLVSQITCQLNLFQNRQDIKNSMLYRLKRLFYFRILHPIIDGLRSDVN